MGEQHEKQFRGVWVPAELIEAIEAKTISGAECLLLLIVESLVINGREGCFASNEWLGQRIGKSPDSVCRYVSHLKKLGFLKQVKWDGRRRYLETSWSRLGTGDDAETGKIPKQTRRKSRHTNTKLLKQTVAGTPATGSKSQTNGITPGFMPELDDVLVNDTHGRNRLKLQQALVTARKLTKRVNKKAWDRSFRLLEQEIGDPKRITSVLVWYCRNIGVQYVPVAYSAGSFRSKFIPLEDAMHRAQGNGEAPELKDVHISKKAGRIADALLNNTTFTINRKVLAKAVRLSMDNYCRMHSALYDACINQIDTDAGGWESTDSPSNKRFGQLLGDIMPAEQTYIKQWMTHLKPRKETPISKLIFTRDHPKFKRDWCRWFADLVSNPAQEFERMQKLISEGEKQ